VWSSLIYDYLSRQKLSGTHMKSFTAKQIACPRPEELKVRPAWGDTSLAVFIRSRALELTYFSSARLRDLARRRHGSPHHDLWDAVALVMSALSRPGGDPRLLVAGLQHPENKELRQRLHDGTARLDDLHQSLLRTAIGSGHFMVAAARRIANPTPGSPRSSTTRSDSEDLRFVLEVVERCETLSGQIVGEEGRGGGVGGYSGGCDHA
jgi:hypothetical protein